jgi:hypothetical protein
MKNVMSIFQILLSKIFSIFDRFSSFGFFRNCQKIFCVPSICLKLNHQIFGLLIKWFFFDIFLNRLVVVFVNHQRNTEKIIKYMKTFLING